MESPGPSIVLTTVSLVISFILIFLNAFFVAAEFAIVKVRRTRLQELAGQGVGAARISILCIDQLDDFLSATQLGITIVSLGLGWIGESAFYRLFVILFPESLGPNGVKTALHVLATAVSFFIITLLHVVLGELVPKSMAIQKAEAITLKITRPLRLFFVAAKPMIRAFTMLANWVLRRLGYCGNEEPPLSEEELKLMMKESHDEGVISESEAQIINRAFSFSDKRSVDIMIPAEQVNYLSLKRSYEDNMAVARQRMHTRFPLTLDGLDSIIGVVHMKDVLHVPANKENNEIFRQVARPPTFIDPGIRQDRLMKLFKDLRVHLAIVQEPKTKKNIGIVTMEDILEGLVGEIPDEYGH